MSIYRGRTRKEFYLASTLYDSIEDRDLSAVESLLSEKQADPNLVLAKQGISPFHLAIGCDSESFALLVTTLILQHNGNPNVRSDDGLTPVHIAAAWGRLEILKLLLICGGDPEARDINYKTPLHYAKEENFVDCLNLLKSHLPTNDGVFNKEIEDCNDINIVLDKILINNGSTIGEYAVVTDNKQNSIIEKHMPKLPLLPQSDTTEFIINWVNKQNQNTSISPSSFKSKSIDNPGSSTESMDSFESSVDESDNEHLLRANIKNITFRKVYRKTRKISKTPEKPVSPVIQKSNDNISSGYLNCTSNFGLSLESGIEILSTSKHSQNTMEELKNNMNLSLNKHVEIPKIDKDSSSDYMTCSSNSMTNNCLEKNIFEITEDVSHLLTSDESKSFIALPGNKNESSEGLGSDSSTVSVSEVYKYEDKDKGIVLYERRFLKTPSCNGSLKSSSFSSKLSSLPETIDYDTDTLRKELTSYGFHPGPITVTTKKVYLKKLRQLIKHPVKIANDVNVKKVYSVELERTLRDSTWLNDVTPYKLLEEALTKQFNTPDPHRKWREGVCKSSFTYLLLDPRITNNLPCRSELLQPNEIWETFLSAIFYVGKGKRARPYSHLYEAVTLWNNGTFVSDSKKLQHIIDIWVNNKGVVCLHLFQNIIPVEAYTREAAMISALNIQNVRNIKSGDFYGIAATWTQRQKKMLGVYLLYKAMMIFLNEGERQLCPADID